MKKKKIMLFLTSVFAASCLCLGSAFAEDAGIIKLFDFDSITSISEYTEFSGTSNSDRGVVSEITDGAFTIGKHTPDGGTQATHTMYIDLDRYIGTLDTYTVKLDINPTFASGKNFIVRCGVNIQPVSRGNGKFVVQRMIDGAFKTENTAEFSFAGSGEGIAFVIKNRQYVDVYYQNGDDMTLIYKDLEYIESSSTKKNTLGFTFNKASDGDIRMDNVTLTSTVPKVTDITKLEFENIGDELTLDYGDAVRLPIRAEANSGIRKIKIYIDGELSQTLTEEPYVAEIGENDKKTVSVRAAAESNDGDEKETELSLNYRSVDKSFSIFEDSQFTEGDSDVLDSGISLYPRRGFTQAKQIDEEHGDSLAVGVDEPDAGYSASDIPYVDIPLKNSAGRISISYELYIDTVEDSGKKTMVLRMSNDKEVNLVRFTGNEMKILNRLVADYEEHTWYRFSIKADTVQNTISIFVNDVPVIYNLTLHQTNADGSLGLKLLRLYGPGEANQGYSAIDNIEVKGYYDLPRILSCETADDGKGIILKLSSKVYGDSINEETVFVKNSSGRIISAERVYYDDEKTSVAIELSKKLAEASEYTVIISRDAMLAEGVSFGEDVEEKFTTESKEISIVGSDINVSGGKCNAAVRLRNVSDREQTIYVVMTLWNGTKGTAMRITPLTLAVNEGQTATLQADANGAEYAQICVYGDIMASKLLGGKIIKSKL